MHAIDYVIYSLWVVFWLGWLIAGASAKRAAQSRLGQFVGLRLATLVIGVLAHSLRCCEGPSCRRGAALFFKASG